MTLEQLLVWLYFVTCVMCFAGGFGVGAATCYLRGHDWRWCR